MVKAIIDIDKRTNTILNIVKAKFGLNDKSQAIDMMAKQYEEEILESQLRPEYVNKLERIKKENDIHFKSVNELRDRIKNA